MKLRKVRKEAREVAWSGAFEDEEPLLNPYKNKRAGAWMAQEKAQKWRNAFLDECHEQMIKNAEDDADEAFPS